MATKKGVVEVVAWGNVSQQWKTTQIVLTQQGRIQEFFIGGGGGGSKLWFRMDCWTFLWQITSPHTPFHQSRLHVINPWPLTCTWILLLKGCTLGTFSPCAVIVDQLKKQRRPRVSQSVNAGRQWRGKYCFESRGEQIIGGYQKTITFLNILGN